MFPKMIRFDDCLDDCSRWSSRCSSRWSARTGVPWRVPRKFNQPKNGQNRNLNGFLLKISLLGMTVDCAQPAFKLPFRLPFKLPFKPFRLFGLLAIGLPAIEMLLIALPPIALPLIALSVDSIGLPLLLTRSPVGCSLIRSPAVDASPDASPASASLCCWSEWW